MPLAAEDRLLLDLARSEPPAEATARATALVQVELDWDYIVEAAVRHAVAPLLKRGLDGLQAADEVPEPVRADLDALHRTSGRRNARLFRALGEIIAAFEEAGVAAMALKDVALAVDVYPERALRPMGDVDLLVRREEYHRAAAALAALGFAPLPDRDVPYTLKYATSQHFRRASDELWVDLQWNVAQREWDLHGDGRFTFPVAELWKGAKALAIDDYELLAPKPEHMLLHLCLHLEGHEYAELVLFSDVVELLEHGAGLDWDELVALARSNDASSSVYQVLLLIERLFGVPLPAGLLRELEPPYFRGSVLSPLYGNLTPLHHALDEIRLATSPPQPVLDDLERLVRRQAARARRLDSELDAFARAFLEDGGTLLLVDGSPSPRRFPDPGLEAFGPLRAFVLEQDLPILEPAARVKRCALRSRDPVLGGDESPIEIAVEVVRELGLALADADGALTNKEAALRSLKSRLLHRHHDDSIVAARLTVFALPPDELAVALAARVGGRLFGLCNLLELCRRLPVELDRQRVADIARLHGVEEAAAGGLALAAAVLGREGPAAPRLFEWARYGLESLDRYPGLRRSYLYAIAFLSVRGIVPKARYLARSAIRGLLPRLVGELLSGALRRRRRSAREFAYWLEA